MVFAPSPLCSHGHLPFNAADDAIVFEGLHVYTDAWVVNRAAFFLSVRAWLDQYRSTHLNVKQKQSKVFERSLGNQCTSE